MGAQTPGFTKTSIAGLLRDRDVRVHWDGELGGFGLQIHPSGAASYVVDFRLQGSRVKRRVKLGRVAELGLGQARERAKEIIAAARRGVDLDRELRARVRQRDDEERRRANAMTVSAAVKAYLAALETTPLKRSGRKPSPSTMRSTGAWLSRLIAIHGDDTLETLTPMNVRAVLDATPQSSRRNVFGALKRLFAWARRQDVMQASLLEPIDPPPRPASRDRCPSPIEVRAILKAADDLLASGRWHAVQRDGVWLIALTAQRLGEVASMTWEDVDLMSAEWRQPGHKNKTGKPHVAPLGPHALELLKRRHEAAGRPSHGLVLPGVRHGGRMNANLSNLQGRLRQVTGIEFRLHDFRRAAVSCMAELGVDFAVADSILNHSASQSRTGMLRVYQHAELKPAKRRAMELWESALFDEPPGSNVVPLRAVSAS